MSDSAEITQVAPNALCNNPDNEIIVEADEAGVPKSVVQPIVAGATKVKAITEEPKPVLEHAVQPAMAGARELQLRISNQPWGRSRKESQRSSLARRMLRSLLRRALRCMLSENAAKVSQARLQSAPSMNPWITPTKWLHEIP